MRASTRWFGAGLMVGLGAATAMGLWMGNAGSAAHAREDPLPADVRDQVRPRMTGHSTNMEELLWAVILVEPAQTRYLALGMANAETVSRRDHPGLHPDFFRFQDEAAEHAHELANAAAAHDSPRTAQAFGQLAATCVACHARFMEP